MSSLNSNYIYIGISVPPLGLKTNALYLESTMPSTLKQYADLKPALNSLYIHTSLLAQAKKNIITKGTLEYIANQEMLAIAKTIPR